MQGEGNRKTGARFLSYRRPHDNPPEHPMRALILFLLGVPLPIVLLLAFCTDIV